MAGRIQVLDAIQVLELDKGKRKPSGSIAVPTNCWDEVLLPATTAPIPAARNTRRK